ncbi:MAG: PspC domain-containing protein [Eubacterium sp.]|nr:PspC domain-containing protein [Eubacterium sp.]
MKKKLYRDTDNEMLAGVCAGIAEYLEMDVSVIRLIWVIVTFFGGSGIIAYIVCALIIPAKPMLNTDDYSDLNEE